MKSRQTVQAFIKVVSEVSEDGNTLTLGTGWQAICDCDGCAQKNGVLLMIGLIDYLQTQFLEFDAIKTEAEGRMANKRQEQLQVN
jgi:hypothetical protein